MNTTNEESQKRFAYGISGALLVLITLGYLFVPRVDLNDRSPISVLTLPDKKIVFRCEGIGLVKMVEIDSSEECRKYSGRWQNVYASDGSHATRGAGWSDVGSLIAKDLPSIGGLGLLVGASPAIGFLLFRRIRGNEVNRKTPKTAFPSAQVNQFRRTSAARADGTEMEDRLKYIQALHKQGLITSEELKTKKRELLDEI